MKVGLNGVSKIENTERARESYARANSSQINSIQPSKRHGLF